MPRAPTRNDMKERLDGIRREIEKLQAQETLLLEMLDEKPVTATARAPKGSVKNLVLDLLEETGRSGLNAVRAVEMAKERGRDLERGSVSSLLSRLKADGVVNHDGDRYRLRKHSEMQSAAVTPIRTSGYSVLD